MKANFTTVMGWIGLSEGGYVNNPKDPGGPTDRGITQATYNAWNDRQGLPRKAVKGISRATAEAILASQYFAPVRFNDLPSGLDYAVVDYAVNSGVPRAAKDLQRALGATQDGWIGEQTLAALARRDVAELIVAYCEARFAFMKRARDKKGNLLWDTFKTGWTVRVMGNAPGVQTNDIGVIDRSVRLARGATSIPAPTAQPGRAPEGPTGLAALLALILAFFTRSKT